MTKNSESDNKENNVLIEFMVEDLKETGEHLRDTDHKLSLLIQIYAGAFVLIATLSVNKIIIDFVSLTGLVLVFIFIFFTGWLFEYTLRSKEMKQIYIHRMNFLRTEMHYFLNTNNRDLPGYWTSSEKASVTKELLLSVSPENSNRIRVGLDDLYPNALKGIMFFLCIILAFVSSKIVYNFIELQMNVKLQLLLHILAMLVFVACFFAVLIIATTLTALYIKMLTKDSEKKNKYNKNSLQISSEVIKKQMENVRSNELNQVEMK